jgi:hypothetical protein
LVVLCAAALAAGCAPMLEVSDTFDDEADFNVYTTYNLMSKEQMDMTGAAAKEFAGRREVLEDELVKALKKNMEAKGFKHDPDNPDIMVAYYVGVRNEVFMANYGMHYADYAGNVEVQTVQDGSMRIDFVDSKTERLVWRGSAYGAVNRDPTEDMIRKNVDRAVKKILDQYPPKKK